MNLIIAKRWDKGQNVERWRAYQPLINAQKTHSTAVSALEVIGKTVQSVEASAASAVEDTDLDLREITNTTNTGKIGTAVKSGDDGRFDVSKIIKANTARATPAKRRESVGKSG